MFVVGNSGRPGRYDITIAGTPKYFPCASSKHRPRRGHTRLLHQAQNLELALNMLGGREPMSFPDEPAQRDLPTAPVRPLDSEHVHPAAEPAAQSLRSHETPAG